MPTRGSVSLRAARETARVASIDLLLRRRLWAHVVQGAGRGVVALIGRWVRHAGLRGRLVRICGG